MAVEHWPLVPLGELTENLDGRRIPVKEIDRMPGPYPYYGASGIVDQVDGYLFDGEYLLIGEDGENLRTRQTPIAFMATGKFWVNNHAHIVRGNHRADTRFLSYVLSQTDISGYLTGSTMPKLTQGNLNRLPVIAPPLSEQKTIAAVLGALDDKIELNRRMNATLEAVARALFQSWFVDFDPVRAKLDGRQSHSFVPATATIFPEHFEHGEDGLLPVGWRHANIGELCGVNGCTLSKHDDFETLEYVEISEVSRGNIASIATYTRGEEPSRARRRLRHGDTVLSTVRPDRGSYFLALNPPLNRVASTGFAVLTPTKAPWSFIHAALTLPEISDYLGQMADGGAYPAVHPEIIGAIKVAVPDEPKILEAFHRTCAPLFEQAEANRVQSRTLAALRDALLPKLLSGELRVESNATGDTALA